MQGLRVLLVGSETQAGRAAAAALAEAGMRLALVSASTDAGSAFEVQRLARKLGATSQAIDASNEAAVRVMLRQVSKEMDGLDAVVSYVTDDDATYMISRLAEREMQRSGGGVVIDGRTADDIVGVVASR